MLRWYIAGRIMSLLDFWFLLTTSPGPALLTSIWRSIPAGW